MGRKGAIATVFGSMFIFCSMSLGALPTAAASLAAAPIAAQSSLPHYASPTGNDPIVIRRFHMGENNWNPGHRGIDIGTVDGDPIYASSSGTVVYAGVLNDRSVVSIEDARGIRTTYEPVDTELSVGDVVSQGELIGHVTGAHCIVGSCLHFGAKRGSDGYINPLLLLYPERIALLA